ncbi:HNH endonuclease [Mammaliicoccus sciuri]|uniref:HNH endonuclease n=1 Tax=Mammaliicoccus sciuri TaxID=1296 RepID=UPI003C77BDEB
MHRIVAETYRNTYKNKFDSNGNIRNEVDHINVDTFDNRAGNLQWVSSSENGFLMNIRDKIVKGNIDNEAYIQYLNDLRIY